MISSTAKQRYSIDYFRKILQLDNVMYYEVLSTAYGVDSSKKLSYKQASELIEYFKIKAEKLGIFKVKPKALKYDDLGIREDKATPKQLRKIDALWRKVSNQKTDKNRQKALSAFVKKTTGCDHINFLTQKHASKIINIIEKMYKQKKEV